MEALPTAEPLAPLRLVLIRHAESRNNALLARAGSSSESWEQCRQADPGLTKRGLRQAEAAARFLAGEVMTGASAANQLLPLTAVYASPMKRALLTLAPLARRIALRPQVWTDCFEVGGLFEFSEAADAGSGLTPGEMQQLVPTLEVPHDMQERGWFSNGCKEELHEAQDRVRGTAARLRDLARESDRPIGTIAVIGHHDQLNLLLQALLLEDGRCFHHANAGMSCIDIDRDGSAHPVFLEQVSHLRQQRVPQVSADGSNREVFLLHSEQRPLPRCRGPCGARRVRRHARSLPPRRKVEGISKAEASLHSRVWHLRFALSPEVLGILPKNTRSVHRPLDRRCARRGHWQRPTGS